MSLIVKFLLVLDVFEYIVNDGSTSEQKIEADGILDNVKTFNLAFPLHLMKILLGITNELSLALQIKDQNILNAMNLVEIAKERLQLMSND